ncbi:MAG: aminotransferase class I/II [Elusimicrobia bacterium GWC2_51_8]|nr:MAG: aminotransferase class I/II [Elusimicrobia bacterium GWA2_51_34]OGR59198.1 MAG: aminotransferase class I/II [Elusimicrobia bacterium GWC2_51_8]OGR86394.1 MAG: aminotransferase class I/II [Elusimicrobia bacterium GWF2_52_66]HAF96186.1 aminotransferase class I/II [Elusimicrobiota bacterium]HCE97797.1 aminotransferase class I/II [Elusimicrobiota bacterium]
MINLTDINSKLLKARYAVRGKIVIRAQELEEQGKKIIYCNIGNPQALKQKPITFVRQMLSLVEYPGLMDRSEAAKLFPADVIRRAKMILKKNPGGTGAYTQSAGIPLIRQAVADFIHKRDGIPVDANRIVLTGGASRGIQSIFTMLTRSDSDGYMIPIPQYPLYSATIALYGAKQIDYLLDEEDSWQLNEGELTRSIEAARKGGVSPVAIVVINPGNPTGAVLSKENIAMIIRFAKKHGLSILADEVYQENVYTEKLRFHSFAKVMCETGETGVTLFSFHSVSKGFLGECGHRGGYLEARNIPGDVYAELIKLQSIGLCANVSGQLVTYLMAAPPEKGDESFDLYVKERDAILREMKEKAEILGKGLNEIEGMRIDIPRGAMYAFVKFDLPHPKGVDLVKMPPEERLKYEAARDFQYCLSLLEETGICVVPGSGFGQRPGTLHFRTTFLPPKEDIMALVENMKKFHASYTAKLRSR